MITLLNIWHYLFLAIAFFIFIGGIMIAYKKENEKQRSLVIFSFFVISTLLAGFSVFIIDEYTKKVKIYKLENKRNLYTEKIMYSGIVRNEGEYEIGKITIEIKLTNKMQVSGIRNLKHEDFLKSNDFFGSFSSLTNKDDKSQQVSEEFVIAENLKPKESREFRVYLHYPPYFEGFSDSLDISAH